MLGGWIVNVSICQQRVESDRPDRADGRGQWTGQLWHTSLSATHIHLIINVFQLVANKTQVRGRQTVLSGGWSQAKKQHGQNEHLCACPHAKAYFHKKYTHAYTQSQSLTYDSELSIGVDLAMFVSSHTLVHSCVRQGQATDWQCPIGNLYALLWTERDLDINIPFSMCSFM